MALPRKCTNLNENGLVVERGAAYKDRELEMSGGRENGTITVFTVELTGGREGGRVICTREG